MTGPGGTIGALWRRLAPRGPRALAQAARFGAVGLAATAVHYAVLVGCVDGAGLAAAPSNGLAFLVALSVTFLGQSVWVFPGAPSAAARDAGGLAARLAQADALRLARFAAAAVAGFAANAAVMALAVDAAGLPYRAGFAIGLAVVPPLSFVLARSWVFVPHVRLR